VEQLATLLVSEARASFPKAGRVLGKLATVCTLGFVLAHGRAIYLMPVGVLVLAISASWFDMIREECLQHRFFPWKALNHTVAALFRWQLLAVLACGLLSQVLSAHHAWHMVKLIGLPLGLMLLFRTLEPFGFRHARAELQRAESLVRDLLCTEGHVAGPLLESQRIPVYNLGSAAKVLRGVVAGCKSSAKEAVQLPAPEDVATSRLRAVLSALGAPFHSLAGELFLWESRDLVLYIVVVLYMVLTYLGSFYFSLAPLCALCPFLGPKSRVARYVRSMQEDIRLAQGVLVEKKGGMVPKEEDSSEAGSMVNWPMLGYISVVHGFALHALLVLLTFGYCPLFGQGKAVKMETLLLAFVLYILSALGITGGVHRLWAHRSYKAGLPLRVILMIFNSIANQGCIFHWARDHRVHHLYSDTVADPHDARRGFWFSHMGWLILKKHPAILAAGRGLNLTDLTSDPVVMLQKRADPFWNLIWCFAFPAFASLHWGELLWHGFLVAGALRYVCLLHATWAVNSVVHCWGPKPYNPSHKTTENGWVSIFALGEGWHNWHHAFDWDYAAAELGALQQFNPTKVFLDCMIFLGLAWAPKRADKVWETRKARWSAQNGRPVLESLEGPPLFRRRVVTFGPSYEDEATIENSGVQE
jgi:stearoyl-CoA desaturase (delta-9 desaturase)